MDQMENAFGLVVRFTVRPGAEEPFDRLVRATVEKIRANEPDTLIYACHTVPAQRQQRIFYELYRNRVAFETHEQQPHVKAFLAEREQYVATTEVDFLALTTAKGVNPQHQDIE
jgi:quinol monooxygenase YgiN